MRGFLTLIGGILCLASLAGPAAANDIIGVKARAVVNGAIVQRVENGGYSEINIGAVTVPAGQSAHNIETAVVVRGSIVANVNDARLRINIGSVHAGR